MNTQKSTAQQGEVKSYNEPYFTILSGQANKDGTCWIYLEFTLILSIIKDGRKIDKRIRRRFNTNFKVLPNLWDGENQRIKTLSKAVLNRPASMVILESDKQNVIINQRLREFKTRFETAIINVREGKTVDQEFAELKNLFAVGKAQDYLQATSITKYIEEYIDLRKSKGTPKGTLKEFLTVKNRIKVYEKEKQEIITFRSINLTFSDNLIQHLSDKKYHPNTIKKTFQILKTILNFYYSRKDENGFDLSDKFNLPEFGKVVEIESPPMPLSDIEIEVLEKFDFEKSKKKELKELAENLKKGKAELFKKDFYIKNIHAKYQSLERTRTQVLLQISTGLRVSDIFRIKPSNIKGKNIIELRPVKTITTKKDNTIYIPINRISAKILKEIGYDSSRLKISSQNYNDNIKELFKAIGFDEDTTINVFEGLSKPKTQVKKKYELLTSHNMRDTFISKAIRDKVSIPMILKATGQSSYQVMKKYVKLENTDLVEQMKDLY